jgi:hypothetical protein
MALAAQVIDRFSIHSKSILKGKLLISSLGIQLLLSLVR